MTENRPRLILPDGPLTPPSSLSSFNWSEHVETAGKVLGIGASIASVLGFLVFLRYCMDISYFPELSFSASAGFFAAIFAMGVYLTLTIAFFWSMPSFLLRNQLVRWESFDRKKDPLVWQVWAWMSLICLLPCLTMSFAFGTNPRAYRGDPTAPMLISLIIPVLLGLLLPCSRTLLRPDRLLRLAIRTLWGRRVPSRAVASKWGDMAYNQPPRRYTETLPSGLRWALRRFGLFWVISCFAVIFITYALQGIPGMYLVYCITSVLLLWGLGIALTTEREIRMIASGVFLALSFFILTMYPQVPAFIVRALGLGAYNDADVMIEKRYCEILRAQGIPLFVNDSELDHDIQEEEEWRNKKTSYLEVMNDNTILLRHVQVLLRVGAQVALRDNGVLEKKNGLVNRGIMLIPASQVLQVRESLYTLH